MYRVQKQNGKYYIQKRFIFWWFKVPDHGLGWGSKSMSFIEGHKSKYVCEKMMNEYYVDKNKSIKNLHFPSEKELNYLADQYPASGGSEGWIRDAYKKGYIDGCKRKKRSLKTSALITKYWGLLKNTR